MGIACLSKSSHPGEEFISKTLSSLKLTSITFSELKNLISEFKKKLNKDSNDETVLSYENLVEFQKDLYEQNKDLKFYRFHSSILRNLFHEFQGKNVINEDEILFLLFALTKKPIAQDDDESRIIRIKDFFNLLKKINKNEKISLLEFRRLLEKYIFKLTIVITQAIHEELVNEGKNPRLVEDMKHLYDHVYLLNKENYLETILRDFEMKNSIRLQNGVGEIELKEILHEKIYFLYIQDLRNDFVQLYSLS